MKAQLRKALAAGLALTGLLVASFVFPLGGAQAGPDARIDQQIRPCFGLLVEPNVSARCRPHRPPTRPPICHKGEKLVRGHCVPIEDPGVYVIDCDNAAPGEISEAIERYYEGEVLTLTSRNGGVCVDSLTITRSITIVVRDYSPERGRPILTPFPGQPCMRIQPGVRQVVLVGLGIDAPRAGASPCIVGRATELALQGVRIRYDGEASALELGESRLELSQTALIGRTRKAVVNASGVLMAENVEIAATAIGMAFEPVGDSRVSDLRIIRLGDWTGSSRTRNSAGLVLTGVNRQQLVQIADLDVDGFSRGVYVGGGDEVALVRPVVRDSDWAVVLENASLRVMEGGLEATDVGIYVASGTVNASDNTIVGVMRAGVYADNGGVVRSRGDRVFPRSGGCASLVTGHFNGSLTCRPWFEAPEIFRTPRDRARVDFDSYWPDGAPAPSTTGAASPSLSGGPQPAEPDEGGASK